MRSGKSVKMHKKDRLFSLPEHQGTPESNGKNRGLFYKSIKTDKKLLYAYIIRFFSKYFN
jgi:hypothetical protein